MPQDGFVGQMKKKSRRQNDRQKAKGGESVYCASRDLQPWRKGPRVASGAREGQAAGHQEETMN